MLEKYYRIMTCGVCQRIFRANPYHIRSGHAKSCGCLKTKHGATKNGQESLEYSSWRGMKDRCLNPNNSRYNLYGGRGIRVCWRWLLFENFLKDMGGRPSRQHSLDRIDNDGNYEPNNCRRATPRQQAANQRHRNQFSQK